MRLSIRATGLPSCLCLFNLHVHVAPKTIAYMYKVIQSCDKRMEPQIGNNIWNT